VAPGDPERLAEALVALASKAPLRRRLAIGAFAARRRFDSASVARRVAAVLRTAASDGARVAMGKALETIPAGP
jgi:glycosyltransferase involved in cell wall biosynthesis